MADETKSVATVKQAAGITAGVGLGALLASLVQGNPAIVTTLVNWGPAFIVLGGVTWVIDRHAPALTAAHVKQAEAISALTATMQQHVGERNAVQMAVATLAGKIDELADEVRTLKR